MAFTQPHNTPNTTSPDSCRIDASAGVLNLNQGNWFTVAFTGNVTLSLAGEQPSQDFMVEFVQPAAGGPYDATFWSGITWITPGATRPTMPTAANAVLLAQFKCVGGGLYYGWLVGPIAAAGVAGATGVVGVTGATGIQGATGIKGATGIQGVTAP